MKKYEVTTKTLITKRYRVEAENEKQAVYKIVEPFDYIEDDEEVVCVEEVNHHEQRN